MKLNLPKNQKYYYWTVIDLLASSASITNMSSIIQAVKMQLFCRNMLSVRADKQ